MSKENCILFLLLDILKKNKLILVINTVKHSIHHKFIHLKPLYHEKNTHYLFFNYSNSIY